MNVSLIISLKICGCFSNSLILSSINNGNAKSKSIASKVPLITGHQSIFYRSVIICSVFVFDNLCLSFYPRLFLCVKFRKFGFCKFFWCKMSIFSLFFGMSFFISSFSYGKKDLIERGCSTESFSDDIAPPGRYIPTSLFVKLWIPFFLMKHSEKSWWQKVMEFYDT